jgi:hypothetical protein
MNKRFFVHKQKKGKIKDRTNDHFEDRRLRRTLREIKEPSVCCCL